MKMANKTKRISMTHKIEDDIKRIDDNFKTTDNNFTNLEGKLENKGSIVASQSAVTGNVTYYKSYGIVNLSISHSRLTKELSSYGTVSIFTLPSGYRPHTTMRYPLVFDNNSHSAIIQITSNGVVSIVSRSGSKIPTSGVALMGSVTFST